MLSFLFLTIGCILKNSGGEEAITLIQVYVISVVLPSLLMSQLSFWFHFPSV